MSPISTCLKRKFQPVGLRTASHGEGTSRRRLTFPSSCDSRYMTSLTVHGESLDLGAANNDPNHHVKLTDKIAAALKILAFREEHVLVQFWLAHEDGKNVTLTTKEQPFGVGVIDAGRLQLYRDNSEKISFVVDKQGHEEENRSPAARVFRRGLPEWTSDLDNCTSENFPQQECAIRCGLHGYLGLPVFDSDTRLCVGVLELLTPSKYMNYVHEVEQICRALETENVMISPQGFDFPALYVPNESKQNGLDQIYRLLKTVCDIHSLPLAQTWSVSRHCSYVARENFIEKSCSSFDSRCVGKVCMSTTALPYHVKDLSMWGFRRASIERHLDSSCRLVGKALTTRGSCFCGDVTELGEEEYPLVHSACKHGLTGCFAIFIGSIVSGDDYVLEFFLPPDIKDPKYLLNLVQTLTLNIPIFSGFELGDTSCLEDLFGNMVSDVSQTSSESDYMDDNFKMHPSVTEMVTAKITLNGRMVKFKFSISLGLLDLVKEVAQRFKLKDKDVSLKYRDEEDDLIRIANDVDLKFAVDTAGSKNKINLICEPGYDPEC